MFDEVKYRKDVADQIGIGFAIPSSAIVRIVRRNEVEIGGCNCLVNYRHEKVKSGAPGEIRTPGLLVRSQTLYPAELRAHRMLPIAN